MWGLHHFLLEYFECSTGPVSGCTTFYQEAILGQSTLNAPLLARVLTVSISSMHSLGESVGNAKNTSEISSEVLKLAALFRQIKSAIDWQYFLKIFSLFPCSLVGCKEKKISQVKAFARLNVVKIFVE